MNTFDVKDGQFWLNGQPQLIQAGEFHYFRTPPDQWEHRLGLLRSAGFNTVAAYIPWLWHQPQPELTDVDGHSHPMRNLAGFLDLAANMGLYIIARPGPYIMAETINEGIPPWVFSQYPQTAFIAQDGKVQNVASYLHPDFLKCVEGWYQAVFKVLAPRQITRGGKILMIQLDNEMGMIQWVRNIVDINPDTLSRFAAYLRETYGKALGKRYRLSHLDDFLREQITNPQLLEPVRMLEGSQFVYHSYLRDYAARSVIEDYRRFYRTYLRDYTSHLWERAEKYGMEVLPVVNIHGFGNGGKTFPIGLSQLIEVIQMEGMVSATDVYPIFIGEGNFHQLLLVNEMTKALQNPQQPLFSIEFQAGGNPDFGGAQSSLYDLHTRLCISCGMRAINHYLFFDGENDPVLSPTKRHDWGHPVRKDGTLRRHYARYPKLARALKAYGPDLVRSRPKTVATIGFVLDDFMTEVNNTFTKSATDILTHQRDVILFDFLARGLALTHRPFNALDLAHAALDVKQTPVLFAMMEMQCDDAVEQRLLEYVRLGGRLILVGRMGEETFDHTPNKMSLAKAIGIRTLSSDQGFRPAVIHAFDYRDIPVSFLEMYSAKFDEVFATTPEGQTVGFIKQVGKGKVMVLGAALAANTLDDLDILHQMANRMDCQPLFSMSDWVDVRLSEGENGSFLFINNYQDDPVETTISAANVPLLGGHSLTLPARRGVILPLEWRIKPGVLIHYLTSEITDVTDDDTRLTIKTDAPECFAEISLKGYRCNDSLIFERIDNERLKLHGKSGVIDFVKDNI